MKVLEHLGSSSVIWVHLGGCWFSWLTTGSSLPLTILSLDNLDRSNNLFCSTSPSLASATGWSWETRGCMAFSCHQTRSFPPARRCFTFHMHPQIPTWQEVESINQLNLKTEYVFCFLQTGATDRYHRIVQRYQIFYGIFQWWFLLSGVGIPPDSGKADDTSIWVQLVRDGWIKLSVADMSKNVCASEKVESGRVCLMSSLTFEILLYPLGYTCVQQKIRERRMLKGQSQ